MTSPSSAPSHADFSASGAQHPENHDRLRTESLQSALLTSITHDFRTPLSTIIGAASSLLDDGNRFSDADRRALIAAILGAGERLNRYVNNLLAMSRLEAGAISPNLDWVEVGDVIGTALSNAAEFGNRRVGVEMDEGLPMLHVDFVLFEQVLLNLLDNAAKYSPPGSMIRIEAREDGDSLRVNVINDCEPLNEEQITRLFDKFYRAGARPETEGSGLGLSICKGFVEAQGGTIAARPFDGGKGLAVTILLPITQEARQLAADLKDE